MTAELLITDGTTTIDLLAANYGYHLDGWQQQITTYKGGGIHQDSPLVDGRRLVDKYFQDAIEAFTLRANASSEDAIFYDFQELIRLLEKATNYWATDWQNTPVYLQTKSSAETNTRYAVIKGYQVSPLPNPLGGSFLQPDCAAAYDEFSLSIERGDWTENVPGSDTDVELAASASYDSRSLGFVTPTTDPIIIGNRRTAANLTDIYNHDVSGPSFSSNLLDASLPTILFPSPATSAGGGDAIYFGIDTSLSNSGPFGNLVLDIGTPASATLGYDFAFEYWNGSSWTAIPNLSVINIDANSEQGSGDYLSEAGLTVIGWTQPSNWATTTVNGVTGYWIRIHLSFLSGIFTNPTQQNRDIFTAGWNDIRLTSDQIGGDIPALARWIYQIMVLPSLEYTADRIICGLRSEDRGASFVSILNMADEQNPTGLTLTAGTNTAFADDPTTPTGRRATYNPGGAESMGTRITIEIGQIYGPEWFGTYRCFLRATQSGGADGDISVQVGVGVAAVLAVTNNEPVALTETNELELLDLGQITLPAATIPPGSDAQIQIFVQASSLSGTPNLNMYDLILIPVDEWAGDFINPEVVGLSVVGVKLDVDSITVPKAPLLSSLDGTIKGFSYQAIAPGPMIWRNGKNQRLYFLTAYRRTTGGHTFWQSWFEGAGAITGARNQRYRSGRGAR